MYQPVVLYCKCTQRTICFYIRKGRLLKKIQSQQGRPPHPSPLWIRYCIHQIRFLLLENPDFVYGTNVPRKSGTCMWASVGLASHPTHSRSFLGWYVHTEIGTVLARVWKWCTTLPRNICLISRAPRDAVNLLTTSRAVCSYELSRLTSTPDCTTSHHARISKSSHT